MHLDSGDVRGRETVWLSRFSESLPVNMRVRDGKVAVGCVKCNRFLVKFTEAFARYHTGEMEQSLLHAVEAHTCAEVSDE